MYIEKLHSPQALKQLSLAQLEILADEIRCALIAKMSQLGGHVGSNLGAIELTIALHYVLNCPQDQFVFDTSHQTYTHKILTGRAGAFTNPECYDRVTGYSNPLESDCDPFTIGHTSTSISLALGLCYARDLLKQTHNVVAIIGDGSLSGGMAMEGLNCAGEYSGQFIIVVNDNQMSIQENHGGIYKNLSELRATNGQSSNNWFRTQGLDYLYINDGHDIKQLIEAFQYAKSVLHPIVVHINTSKGRGLSFAEADRENWHYSAPFSLSDGHREISRRADYSEITGDFIERLSAKYDNMMVLAAGSCLTIGLTEERRSRLGDRYIDSGIAEEHVVALASGIAKNGGSPVFGTWSTFLQRCYDQLSQDVCINHSPITLLCMGCSIYGLRDVNHLSIFDIPLISNIPNMVYLAPTCCEEYLAMFDWAIGQNRYPVAIRIPGASYNFSPVLHDRRNWSTDYSHLNQYLVEEKGSEVAIIAVGSFFSRGLLVMELLREKGINATLINPRYLTGLDEALLTSLAENHSLVVTLEEGIIDGGFGEKIARFYSATSMKVLVRGIKKNFYSYYDPDELLFANRLQPEQVVCDVLSVLGNSDEQLTTEVR